MIIGMFLMLNILAILLVGTALLITNYISPPWLQPYVAIVAALPISWITISAGVRLLTGKD